MRTKHLKFYFASLFCAAVLAFSSCSKDDTTTTTPAVQVEDGTYITGSGTAVTTLSSKGLMDAGRNEASKNNLRTGLFEKYIAIKGGTKFSIVVVSGTTHTIYGPATEVDSTVTKSWDDQIKGWVARGTTQSTDTTKKFTVPSDGLYHVAIDMTTGTFVVLAVPYWNIIGAATKAGWSDDTTNRLVAGTFGLDSMKFEITNYTLLKGDFKLRHSGGWKYRLSSDKTIGDSLKINTNFGGTIGALVAGGANITNTVPGFYTLTITYTIAGGIKATFTKTGDPVYIDYSTYEMGIIGNSYLKTDGTTQANWDENYPTSTKAPVKVGNVYTWTYTAVAFNLASGQFKFRQGTDWNGKSIGYKDVTLSGNAASTITTNNDGNFVLAEVGTYNLVLTIDASTETYTLAITK